MSRLAFSHSTWLFPGTHREVHLEVFVVVILLLAVQLTVALLQAVAGVRVEQLIKLWRERITDISVIMQQNNRTEQCLLLPYVLLISLLLYHDSCKSGNCGSKIKELRWSNFLDYWREEHQKQTGMKKMRGIASQAKIYATRASDTWPVFPVEEDVMYEIVVFSNLLNGVLANLTSPSTYQLNNLEGS